MMETAEKIVTNTEATFSSFSQKSSNDLFDSTELMHVHPTTQILLTTKPPIHVPEAGLNPLVDAAAYLFSFMGKLRHTKHLQDLEKLHAELAQEVENFRESVHAYSYKADHLFEYNLVCCYALNATLDNIISNTAWGSQGKWEAYSLVNSSNQASISHENILIILERLVRDPAIYIDVMEFMYVCLNLGLTFKQPHATSEFSGEQLEQIAYSLYKRIRLHRGNYSKTLTPFSIRPQPTLAPANAKKSSAWLKGFFIASLCLCCLLSAKLWVTYHQTHTLQTDFDIQ